MNTAKCKPLAVTLLRMAIGWHFLYEGYTKWLAGDWTAAGYLAHATGPFAGFYHWLAGSEALMAIVNPANVYGLIAIGLALFLGVATRLASVFGVLLLTLYYFAYPPFGGTVMGATDGNLFIVNKVFIEALTLLALVLIKEEGYGLQEFLLSFFKRTTSDPLESIAPATVSSRRESLKNLVTLPALGVMGWGAFHQRKPEDVDAMSGATIKIGAADLSELKGELDQGKLGDHRISRLVLGGNLIGGWAHSRDLRYVPSLFRAYNTEAKIFETLMLAEQAGVNAINIGFPSNALMQKYKQVTGGKIKVICQVAPDKKTDDYLVNINKAIDFGVDIIQVQGNWCDWLVRDKKYDKIALMLDTIREQGYVAGLGAHTVDSLIECREQGIIPDYYMKTMHHDNYWSAHPRENRKPFEVDGARSSDHNQFHDNCFCPFQEKTIAFVEQAEVPVMGFKVLAAGAIAPEDGFKWAFKHGADFICVGMFDFQIVNDVNITLDVLQRLKDRKREWYA
ncbi:DoxX family protein [Novipirellula artificiosorum]|uniref:DoxX n=1 Tax=Novipirellula artificiosorum TaxID=2528016 RepID=A0A5C6DEH1_9BACT|nr:DoxX family protein [Novipirellula artificiosorum]TWU34324.1 hypothetical protein Poly41_44710 [Novipirellula artificiosorum]